MAKRNGADDSEVMQPKHKTSAMIRRYTRLDNGRQPNAGKKVLEERFKYLGLTNRKAGRRASNFAFA